MTRRIILVDIGAGLTLAGVLPSVALLADYSAQLKARGGQAPYTYTVTTGAAELTAAGLQLDPATGIISGTASVPGTIAITVRATDLSGAYVERGFIVAVIAEPLSLSGAAPMWTVGTPYSYTYTAAHGVPPYTWSIASGSLPAGLTLGATGEISGTPTAGNAPAWTVRVTDSAGTGIDLRDNADLQLLGDFADATVGTAYSSDLLINGGDAPYSNPRVTVGALPAGLALSILGDKLRLSGTPAAAATSSFAVAVDSADGQTATNAQSVVVAAASASYNSVVAAAAPAAWYRLDETTGTSAADSSGSALQMSVVGSWDFSGVGVSVPAPAGFAGLGRGLDLSATPNGSLIRAVGFPSTTFGGTSYSGSWTVVIWVAGSAQASQYLASRVNNAAIIYQFVADTVEFFSNAYTGTDPRPGSQISLPASDTATPHMIVYRYDAGQWSGFKDAVKVFDFARSFYCSSSNTLYFANDGVGHVSKSRIFDSQFYGRGLSDAEIAAMYAAKNAS